MIPLLSRESAREYDADSIARLGVSGALLMENAGAGAAAFVRARFSESRRVLCVGGTGQNGGDAWVVARHLHAWGWDVRAVLVGSHDAVGGDARPNLETLEKIIPVAVATDGLLALQDAELIVDGLFGTGLSREVEGAYAAAVCCMDAAVPIVALDLPSGVDANDGRVWGEAVVAQHTLTFGAPKRGLWQHPGTEYAGAVTTLSLGVPPPTSRVCGLTRADLVAALPRRPSHAHKGYTGHVGFVAGSPGMSGAAILAGRGALRAGAGKVTLLSDADLETRVVECMARPLGDASTALTHLAGMDTAVIGPGMPADETTREIAMAFEGRAVLDAGALRIAEVRAFAGCQGERILTPHPGEASALLDIPTAEVQADRYAAATRLAQESGQVVVLKGAQTVISDGDTSIVCPFGTPAMAVAGTGDVLAGIIGALLHGRSALQAAWLGVGVHALAGEHAAQGDRGLLASELADAVPAVVQGLLA